MKKTTYTLEMSSPDRFKRKESADDDFVVSRGALPETLQVPAHTCGTPLALGWSQGMGGIGVGCLCVSIGIRNVGRLP